MSSKRSSRNVAARSGSSPILPFSADIRTFSWRFAEPVFTGHQAQVPVPSGRNQHTICDLPVLVSSLRTFWRHHFSQSRPRLASSSSNKRQCLKAPSLCVAFCACSNTRSQTATNSAPGTGLLGVRVRHGRSASSRPP
ncbi:uncharacterized protein LACBIDRAFT_298251 [Laccaria bicolor S238N-H82]|uniref:Predicted protein n=1 Tax=Laccaria bicolor (strain S238N-H82 / ATCC MYA-4686) TaxID=486041 RepID=B0DCK2_LACBS|nr:uncharacterized protein LACBIDRAFT_298251 [Laccaria bicolor S238N-H82]EDR07744.1 predicted protein [Laccaria bicolor S238N-H82]|eukprot:XP_001881533.1 predicted protein [Laccaria bicolor S238N-H82]